jgi:alkylation response protein AidB-like acyl-CoA dehydrogenase
MNLDFTEEQEMLRDTVRGLCSVHGTSEAVRAMEDDPKGFTDAFWKELGDMGILGVTIPEEFGGSALSTLDAVIVYEELGRSLAPSPHFVSSVMGAGVLQAAGSDAQKKEWLPKLATGEAILVPTWLEAGNSYGPTGVQLEAKADGDGFVLTGSKILVAFATSATRLVVLARTGAADDAVDLFLVDPSDAGVSMTQVKTLARDTQYEVSLSGVRVTAADRIGAAGSGWKTWSDTLHTGIILLAAWASGGAQRALDITVGYSKERHQFGKPLGAFQALSHNMADAQTLIDGATHLAYEAAWAHREGRDIDRLAPMAKLFACRTYRDVTATCTQIHGGMGFTIEYDIQLYFRRAKQLQLSWWDTRYLEELVASSVLDAD